MKVASIAAACAIACTSTCYARLIGYNIDFGKSVASAPDATFGGAASQPGYWNSLSTGSDQEPILDIHSADAAVTCSVSGGYTTLNYNHSATAGNLQKLLDDFQDTDAARGNITITFDGRSQAITSSSPTRWRQMVRRIAQLSMLWNQPMAVKKWAARSRQASSLA